jgi:tripartite-type tricarboxylate transporter receptor subunit TctC
MHVALFTFQARENLVMRWFISNVIDFLPQLVRVKLWGRAFLALALTAFGIANAQQNWPSRPIRILVPYPAGGSTDILTRLLGQKLAESLSQSVLVENRGGASGGVGAGYFAKISPDDHYFMVASLPMMSINQYLYPKLGYDPDADLVPIGLIAQTPNVIVVAPSLPVHTLKALAEYGRANPDKLSYSSSSVGSAGHLLNELFKTNAGINLLHVPYRGNAPAMQALLAGDVQFTTDNLPQLLPQIRAGKLRALAVTSPKRWFQLPDVPTVAEAGFPNMTTAAWFGLVAQSGTSREVIARMNGELVAILNKPEFIARLREVSFEALPGTPEDMSAAARKERESWKKVVEISGAKGE